jgi:hypothetical protein
MKPKLLLIIAAMASALFIGSWVYAGGIGGGMRGGKFGGGGHGMMGGGHMMDYGRGYTAPYADQYNRYNRPEEPDTHERRETERLMQEIRQKREELSRLYRSPKRDADQIDKTIDELSRLEAELDQKTLGE